MWVRSYINRGSWYIYWWFLVYTVQDYLGLDVSSAGAEQSSGVCLYFHLRSIVILRKSLFDSSKSNMSPYSSLTVKRNQIILRRKYLMTRNTVISSPVLGIWHEVLVEVHKNRHVGKRSALAHKIPCSVFSDLGSWFGIWFQYSRTKKDW